MIAALSRFALPALAVVAVGATAACQSPKELEKATPPVESPPLAAGTYDVQSISYDDATALYQVMLVGVPEGQKPLYQSTSLRLARLSDEEIAAGQKTHLAVDAEGPVAKLTPDFNIALTHNVVEETPQGPVVVRTESSMWSPFMMGMTGAMVGNMLFAPRYYYPPPFSPGVMGGFGASGATRQLASQDFSTRNNGAVPKADRLSKSGFSKVPAGSSMKSSGSGAGSSRLKSTGAQPRPKSSPFGGGGMRRRR